MLKHVLPIVMLAALASCGAGDRAGNDSRGGTAMDNATLTKLDLISSAFQAGQAIPSQYTCDGADQSPPLQWSEPPQGTKSFAIVVDDPDAPGGTHRHWAAYDIPPRTRSLAAGQLVGSQATNDSGKPGYSGPCPPPGHGLHHYHFKLFALDVDKLGVGPDPKVIDVENEARKHALAQGELVGTYERK
jgi:Raf kinase inhibitor-like YbhB/YbcL family protein